MDEMGLDGQVGQTAFLLAQLGAHAAERFADRIGDLELTPAQAGVLRAIAAEPGRSQQALAAQLGTPATRLVALLDTLEQRQLIERRRNPHDRRLHALQLTGAGRQLLAQLGRTAGEHGRELLAALDDTERQQLHALLTRVADHHQLTPGVHPGYRTLNSAPTTGP
jgi:DNA-binding MarR family transcriptional regulator